MLTVCRVGWGEDAMSRISHVAESCPYVSGQGFQVGRYVDVDVDDATEVELSQGKAILKVPSVVDDGRTDTLEPRD